jgi:hypothetical protein
MFDQAQKTEKAGVVFKFIETLFIQAYKATHGIDSFASQVLRKGVETRVFVTTRHDN